MKKTFIPVIVAFPICFLLIGCATEIVDSIINDAGEKDSSNLGFEHSLDPCTPIKNGEVCNNMFDKKHYNIEDASIINQYGIECREKMINNNLNYCMPWSIENEYTVPSYPKDYAYCCVEFDAGIYL